MPCHWIYFIALVLILVLRVLMIDTPWLAEWFWYNGDAKAYYALMELRDHHGVLEFAGGWPLPVFVITMFMYWVADDNGKDIGRQFLLLPLAYLPFSIAGSMLQERAFLVEKLITHPLVLIPSGYLYILPWVVFVWVFSKLRLVISYDY